MQKKTTYKLVPSNKFTRRWKLAKKKFVADTGKKKPATTKAITVFGLKLGTVREGAGIEKALGKIEAAVPKSFTSDKGMDALKNAVAAYGLLYPQYIRQMEATINNAPPGVDKATYTAGIKFLRFELEDISRAAVNQVEKAKHVRGETEVYTIMASTLMKNARLNAGKAMVFIDDVRANPTPDAFNSKVNRVARNMTQQIGNIDKLKEIGFTFDRGQPTEIFAALSPWANDGRQVAGAASREEVLAEVALFEQAVHAVANWAR